MLGDGEWLLGAQGAAPAHHSGRIPRNTDPFRNVAAGRHPKSDFAFRNAESIGSTTKSIFT